MALRAPNKTRSKILDVAASVFHHKGYQGSSLADILADAQVSKGALYHHFANKQELLYAVVDETYADLYLQRWQRVSTSDDPIETIASELELMAKDCTTEDMCRGCPIHNISAELSGVDDGLRNRIDAIFCKLHQIIENGITRAKQKGQVAEQVDEQRVTLLFMSGLNGMPQLVKSCQDINMFEQLTAAIADYIRSFKVNSLH